MTTLILALYLLLIQFFVPASEVYAGGAGELGSALQRHLSGLPFSSVVSETQEIPIVDEELTQAAIYAYNGMQAIWVTPEGPGLRASALFSFLKESAQEGLSPSGYGVEEIQAIWQSRDAVDLARLDTLLTTGLAKYIHDLSYGTIDPYRKSPDLFSEAGNPSFMPVPAVRQFLEAPDPARFLLDLPPVHRHYQLLREALKKYRMIIREEGGECPPIPEGANIKPGTRDARMAMIRQRLASFGLPVEHPLDNAESYDPLTVSAIKLLQRDYGIETDGIIGRKTLAALNINPELIVHKIILNMARWRWQAHELGERYILVNIANYDLRFYEEGSETLAMRAIVGREVHQTPVFSDRVRYIDFNPYWTIPTAIARNEELPALKEDSHYLVKRKVRLFSGWRDDAVELDSTQIDWKTVSPAEMNRYKLRQDPGPWNSLGQIKFAFPNKYDVYIHGTPKMELFEHSKRSFSHGCIRAGNPMELALYLLKLNGNGWSRAKIEEIIESGKNKAIRLKQPVPVHITYQTVWFDKESHIHFNNDIYNRDEKLSLMLNQ